MKIIIYAIVAGRFIISWPHDKNEFQRLNKKKQVVVEYYQISLRARPGD